MWSANGTFNHEEAIVGAFSMIVKTDGSFAALRTILDPDPAAAAEHLVNTERNVSFYTRYIPHHTISRLSPPWAVPSCCLQIRLDTGEFLLRGNNSRAEEVGSRLMCYTATSHCGTSGAGPEECLGLGPATSTTFAYILPLPLAFLPRKASK